MERSPRGQALGQKYLTGTVRYPWWGSRQTSCRGARPKSRSRSGGPGAPDLSQAQLSCPRGEAVWGPGAGWAATPHFCFHQSRPSYKLHGALLSFRLCTHPCS